MIYYKNDSLFIKSLHTQTLKLEAIIKRYGSPVYVYDLDSAEERVLEFYNAFQNNVNIFYALKANANPLILKHFKKLGLGVDTVSWGEILLALKAGFKPQEIIFSGVAKSNEEIESAIKKNILQLNVESTQELNNIARIAKYFRKKVNVAFRMNPDVNPQTHPYITTGFRENKFGMDSSFIPQLKEILKKNKNLVLRGLTLHIGSQLLNFSSIREAIEKTIPIYKNFQSEGYDMKTFDIGGGVGIPYDGSVAPSLKEYGEMVLKLLKPLNCQIQAEPGRLLIGPFGILIVKVQYIKKTPYKNFAIVNSGMHHLVRPALYQASHRIWPLKRLHEIEKYHYEVVGPICESSDFLGKGIELHGLKANDYLAVLDAGAYGYSMASFYNAHKLPKEIIIENGKAKLSPKSTVLKYFSS